MDKRIIQEARKARKFYKRWNALPGLVITLRRDRNVIRLLAKEGNESAIKQRALYLYSYLRERALRRNSLTQTHPCYDSYSAIVKEGSISQKIARNLAAITPEFYGCYCGKGVIDQAPEGYFWI